MRKNARRSDRGLGMTNHHYEAPSNEELRQRADEKGDSIEEIDHEDDIEDDGEPENENPHHYNITM
jgi:hypothetical protein